MNFKSDVNIRGAAKLKAEGAVQLTNYSTGFVKLDGSGNVTIDNTSYSTFNGNYNSLSNLPTLFSGSYTDLTNKPTIPSGNAIIDWTVDQGAVNINPGNYINTTYSVGDGGLTQNNFTNAYKAAVDSNSGKVSDTGTPAILSNGTAPTLNTGIDAAEVRTVIGAGTSSFSGSYTNLTNKPTIPSGNQIIDWTVDQGSTNIHSGNYINTTYSVGNGGLTEINFTTAYKNAVDANTAKVTDTGTPAILSNGATPTLNSGITAAEVRSLIGAGTSSTNTTYTAGAGLGLAGTVFSHSDTSTQASVNNSGRTYIQDITLDTYGHITGITSATETVVDTNTFRAIHDAPVDGATTTSISSNWAFDNVKTSVPAGAVFTDTNTWRDITTSLSATSTTISLAASAGKSLQDQINAKVSDTGTPAILSNGSTPSLNGGITAAEIRSLIGAGTSSLAIGTTSTTAKAGNVTTITAAQASAITANTAKVSDTGTPAILSNGTVPSLNSGITAAEVRGLIGAGTSSTTGTVTSVATGGGLTGGTITTSGTISHADTSSQASVNNSSGTVIQDITLDTYGHITGLASVNLDGRYYTEAESDTRFVNVDGDTMTGVLHNTVAFSAPIFYDRDDTTYFLNPAGQSLLNGVDYINNTVPMVVKVNSSHKSWAHHVSASSDYVFVPSATVGGIDWAWSNGINFDSAGYITTNNFILRSDERLKTKITDLPCDNIDVVWKSFEMKNNEGEYRVGVIAQELEIKHPEFVNTDTEGFKSVKYIDLLIAKIAELEARLEKAGI